jgi:hypothetical protein
MTHARRAARNRKKNDRKKEGKTERARDEPVTEFLAYLLASYFIFVDRRRRTRKAEKGEKEKKNR